VKMDDFAGELHVLLSTLVIDHLVKMTFCRWVTCTFKYTCHGSPCENDDFTGELHVLQVNLSRNKQ
jgi:hypothetical protein